MIEAVATDTAARADTVHAATTPVLWNPNAAVNWSVLFTPIFGGLIHAANWRALGEPQRAAASQRWARAGMVLALVYLALGLGMRNPGAAEALARLCGFVFLLSWYFVSAKSQAAFVKARFGAAYSRQPWGKVLLQGVAGVCAFYALAVVAGALVGVAQAI